MKIQQVSKRRIKHLQSLKLKKNRQKYAAFVVEGRKASEEFIKYNPQIIKGIYALPEWFADRDDSSCFSEDQIYCVSTKELAQISALKVADQVLLECHITDAPTLPQAKRVLYLDGIADPGNLGTIIRSADWFGIDVVYLSPPCVDHYNPKVIQATMGSLSRMPIKRETVAGVYRQYPNLPWLIADINGVPIHSIELPTAFILMVGGESHGIVSDLHQIKPSYIKIGGKGSENVDSLNAAIATSILLHRLIPD